MGKALPPHPPRVLVIDDERSLVDLVRGYFVREGWTVEAAHDGITGLQAVEDTDPDVIVLDLMLPGLDGVEVCRRLRAVSDAYVIMLTARAEEVDRIVGLSVGADDYVTKPFSPRELVARIKALLRRPRSARGRAELGGDGLTVDLARRRVLARGKEVSVTNLEFELLVTLVRDPGVVLSRPQLLDLVWGPDFYGDDHVLDVHVGNLRRKLGDDQQRWIETVRGFGFRFRGEDR
jgi:DNA-binding response OmpR family regulator